MNPMPSETLRDALRRAAAELHDHAPPHAVPGPVWTALPAAPRRSPRRIAWAGGGLALATLAAAVVMLASAPPMPDTQVHAPVATPFLAVAGNERWAQLLRDTREHGPAWVVPTELPRESLAAMGLPYDPARAGEPVRAELLVHPGGDVIAVRFVR
jgi:hypothetical protein